jgi:hypothetical protein
MWPRVSYDRFVRISWFDYGPLNGRNRRVSPVAPRPREGPLPEPAAGAQPWPRERFLMPHTCRSQCLSRAAQLGGKPTSGCQTRIDAVAPMRDLSRAAIEPPVQVNESEIALEWLFQMTRARSEH